MSLKKHIPNTITLLNLLSGCIAIIFAIEGNLPLAAAFVGLGIFFDFFDGLAARVLNVKSELGLQLDSLADVVTSGVVPGIVMFQLLKRALPSYEATSIDWEVGNDLVEWNFPILALFGFAITLASAYRLAKFNVDERQTDSFIGLPTPANALLILSLPLILVFQPHPDLVEVLSDPYFLLAIILFSCGMLNAEIPLFALKFKSWSFKENKFRYGFLLFSLIMVIFTHFAAIPIIVVTYVILSVLLNRRRLAKGKQVRGKS